MRRKLVSAGASWFQKRRAHDFVRETVTLQPASSPPHPSFLSSLEEGVGSGLITELRRPGALSFTGLISRKMTTFRSSFFFISISMRVEGLTFQRSWPKSFIQRRSTPTDWDSPASWESTNTAVNSWGADQGGSEQDVPSQNSESSSAEAMAIDLEKFIAQTEPESTFMAAEDLIGEVDSHTLVKLDESGEPFHARFGSTSHICV